MISAKKVLAALNTKAVDVATTIDIDYALAGRELDGEYYTTKPDTNYIDFYLITNEIDRRNLANNQDEVMLSSIYQVDVFAGKSKGGSPDMVAIDLVDQVRAEFPDGLTLTNDGQDVEIYRTNISPRLDNDTHVYYAVSVYFNVIS